MYVLKTNLEVYYFMSYTEVTAALHVYNIYFSYKLGTVKNTSVPHLGSILNTVFEINSK